MAKLGRDEGELRALGALCTAREIEQQPAMLRKTHAALVARKHEVESFLRPLLDRAAIRVILTGAGTSGFIGECLAPYLAARLRRRVEAIPTTDLVCAPYLYFEQDTPTLVVSFGRSGNSPESVAALDLADRFVDEIHHLAITCNPDGALAREIAMRGRGRAILLPEETHDQGFAMTSSFSCMTYAALAALSGIDGMQARVERVARAVEAVIAAQAGAMKGLAARGYERVVCLGSHIFKGLAREAALKAAGTDRRRDDRGIRLAPRFPARAEDDRQRQDARRDVLVQRRLHPPLRPRPHGRDPSRRQARRRCSRSAAALREYLPGSSASWSPPWKTRRMSISWSRSLPHRRYLRSSWRSPRSFAG